MPPEGHTSNNTFLQISQQSFCNHVFAGTTGREELPSLYPRHVQPLLGLTVKGFLFWQGENNLATNAISGNSVGRYGYGCELPALIRTWRALWSNSFGGVAPNTTAPDAPFGIVTLHTEAGWMGARDFGGMRWAQTANYGVAPNPALPNTFVAQAYDLPDPWYIRPMCDEWHCCTVHPFAPHDVSKAGLARLDSCNKSTAALAGRRYARLLPVTPADAAGFHGQLTLSAKTAYRTASCSSGVRPSLRW